MNIFRKLFNRPKAPSGLHLVATPKAVVIYNDGAAISVTPALAHELAEKLPLIAIISERLGGKK